MRRHVLLGIILLSFFNSFSAKYYWVGGSGEWTNFKNWAPSSGSSFRINSVPGKDDSIYFDANSFVTNSDTVFLPRVSSFKYIEIENLGYEPTFYPSNRYQGARLEAHGNIHITSLVNMHVYINLRGVGSNTLRMPLVKSVSSISQSSGAYTLLDSITAYRIAIRDSFYSAGYQITANGLNIRSSYQTDWNFQNSTINILGDENYYSEILEVNNVINTQGFKNTQVNIFGGGTINFYSADTLSKLVSYSGRSRIVSNGTGRIDTLELLQEQEDYTVQQLRSNYIKVLGKLELLGTVTFKKAAFYQDVDFGAFTIDTLLLHSSSQPNIYNFNQVTNYVADSFSHFNSGCSIDKFINTRPAFYCRINKSTGNFHIENATIQGMTFQGGATFTASSVGNSINNTGISITNITPTADYYWVGNSGNWSDHTNWSITSGGSPLSTGSCLPNSMSNVHFDANSFTTAGQTVTMDIDASFASMDWTGVTNNPTFSSSQKAIQINGDLTLNAAMTWDVSGDIELLDTAAFDLEGQTLTTGDFTILNHSVLTLNDSLRVNGGFKGKKGKLTTNNHDVSLQYLVSELRDTFIYAMGTSTLTILDNPALVWDDTKSISLTNTATYNGRYSTINCLKDETSVSIPKGDLSTIKARNSTSIYLGAFLYPIDSVLVYGNIPTTSLTFASHVGSILIDSSVSLSSSFSAGKLICTGDISANGSMSIDTLVWNGANRSQHLQISNNSILTINDSIKVPTSTCARRNKLRASWTSATPTLSLAAGLEPDFSSYIIEQVNLGGLGIPVINSTNKILNSSGWAHTNTQFDTLYWVGNSGNWYDPNHWATSSGGTPLGCVSPDSSTFVFFDENSFTTTGQTLRLGSSVYCKQMDWRNVANRPTLDGSNKNIAVFGNVHLSPSMEIEALNQLKIENTQKSYIQLSGHLVESLRIDGLDTVKALGNIRCSRLDIYSPLSLESNSLVTDYATLRQHLNLLNSTFVSNSRLSLYSGWNINLTNSDVTLNGFVSGISYFDNIQFNKLTIGGLFNKEAFGSNTTFDSLMVSYSSGGTSQLFPRVCNYLEINSPERTVFIRNTSATIPKIKIHSSIYFSTAISADTLLLQPKHSGAVVTLFNDVTVNDSLLLESSPCVRLTINGTYDSLLAPIGSSANTDHIRFLSLRYGRGTLTAGINSEDIGFNSGITFLSGSPSIDSTSRLSAFDTCLLLGQTINLPIDPHAKLFYLQNTLSPFDTLSTGQATFSPTTSGQYKTVAYYGPGCTVESDFTVGVKYTSDVSVFTNKLGNNSWFSCENWSYGCVPDSTTTAIVPSGKFVSGFSLDTMRCKNLINNGFFVYASTVLEVFGNIENNFALILSGTGKLRLLGQGSDTIKGNYQLGLSNFEINKQGSLLLENNIQIVNDADFHNGIVYSSPNNKIIFNSASTCNGGTPTSYVDGPMDKVGNTAFVFPSGDNGRWARIGISAPSSASTFSAEYFSRAYTDVTNITSPMNRISELEYWQLDRNAGSGAVQVSLYYEDSTYSGIIDPNNLVVAKHTSTSWLSMGKNTNVHTNGKGHVTSNFVTTFSPFTFGSLNNLNYLPVEFLSVEAMWIGNDATVSWQTASETNNSHFVVEYSPDNSKFIEVGEIKSHNANSKTVLDYTFSDIGAYYRDDDIAYYRVKQIDNDGRFTYSKSVYLDKKHLSETIVYPNPSKKTLYIHSSSHIRQVEVVDMLGKTVCMQTNNLQEIDISKIRKGTYTLVLRALDGSTRTVRFVKI